MTEQNIEMSAILTLEEFNSDKGDPTSSYYSSKMAAISCVKDGNHVRLVNVVEFLQQIGEDHNSATVYRFLGWFPAALNKEGVEIKYMTIDENWYLQPVSIDAVEGLKRL